MSDNIFDTPLQAQDAFYRAFELRDLDAMMAVWSEADYVECIHPMGDRLQGHKTIRESWADILAQAPGVTFQLVDQRQIQRGDLSFHMVVEHLHLPGEEHKVSRILATNVYEKSDAGWKLILHHASSAPREKTVSESRSAKILH